MMAFALMMLGLGIAPLHLGRPHLAFRALLGFRTSWLSREMLTFGPMPPLAVTCLALTFQPEILKLTGFELPFRSMAWPLAGATSLVAILGIICSAMIYIDTPRPWWNHPRTMAKFFLTSICFGSIFTHTALLIEGQLSNFWTLLSIVSCVVKLAIEASIFADSQPDCFRSAKLMKTALKPITTLRFVLGFLAILLLSSHYPILALGAPLLWLAGDLAERYLFFTAVVAPRMPGERVS